MQSRTLVVSRFLLHINSNMNFSFLFLAVLLLILLPVSSSVSSTFGEGSSLLVENPKDVLISPSGVFTAGFYLVGDNAYCFAIWFSKPSCYKNCTIVWMANRNFPVNGKGSKLLLQRNGNLILTDASKSTAWSSETQSFSPTVLHLSDLGNLALRNLEGVVLWQSFDTPTDTLLPLQQFTREKQLVSSRSETNFSSGFYKLFFDDDNLLHLLYDGPDTSSLYWPEPWRRSWEGSRFPYNNSRIFLIDSFGMFTSSDNFTAVSTDYGVTFQRMLKLDSDGNARLYSREKGSANWVVSWQAISQPCRVHGICGPNSTCTYDPTIGRKCSCLPGYTAKNVADWSSGCEPEFHAISFDNNINFGFLKVNHVDFYGNDIGFTSNYTLKQCEEVCLRLPNCKGFQYKNLDNNPDCYPKILLQNGLHSPSFGGDFYVKVPQTSLFLYKGFVSAKELNCSAGLRRTIHRVYRKTLENGTLKFIRLFAVALGGIEFIGMLLIWCFLAIKSHKSLGENTQDYHLAVIGFRRFTFSELKRATQNFSEEIGRGSGGIVYRGKLSDNRVAAIKRLNTANQGEDEFLAELSSIGKLNHMNLIEMWGFCVEGKNRVLIYEYLEHGSLAENLSSKALDLQKRFDIALGTARGLAYLHEECLEWVLHCDVKPQNILLDSQYFPKVSDFGLSKLLNRGESKNSDFSRIRGTRGYLAPEWILDTPITSKVDVYSYGVVLLEMVTGKSPAIGVYAAPNNGKMEEDRLVTWVRSKKNGTGFCIEEIVDPKLKLEGEDDKAKMETLLTMALQCVEEDKDLRPTMRTIVETLSSLKTPDSSSSI